MWNIMDLVMTAFCVITLLFIFFAGCGNTSKEEELLDTLLLVGRNVLQFGRLAAVMRQYVMLSIRIYRVCVSVSVFAWVGEHATGNMSSFSQLPCCRVCSVSDRLWRALA